jgi:RND family efflux transporter MFP subunit
MRCRMDFSLPSRWLVAGTMVLLVAGCSPEESAPEKRPELPVQQVEVVIATRLSQPVFEQVVGSVTARTKPVVSAKISGTIQSLGADVGDRVKSGQLLAEIDAREIQARLDQALPQLESARQSAARIRELVQAKAVSQQQDDDAVARVKQMEAVVAEARTMLSYAKVVSPIDGVVRARRVDVGDLASAGKPLFELEGLEDFRFDAGIPESLTGRIRKGDRARIGSGLMQRERT